MPDVFDKKVCASLWKLAITFKIRVNTKKVHRVLKFNQSQWLKTYVDFNTQKRIKAEKNDHKDVKVLYKLLNSVVYGKTMENVRNKIDVKLVSKEKNYIKRTSKPSHMSQKIFDNDLVETRKI